MFWINKKLKCKSYYIIDLNKKYRITCQTISKTKCICFKFTAFWQISLLFVIYGIFWYLLKTFPQYSSLTKLKSLLDSVFNS